jgi:hypothetical protein
MRLFVFLLVVTTAASSEAQLFGPRNIGRNARGQNLTAPSRVGTVTENRRFVRGQRAADDFVGTDRTEAAAFIGNTQSTNDGAAISAVEGLRETPTMQVNRGLNRRPGGIYMPRLRLADHSSWDRSGGMNGWAVPTRPSASLLEISQRLNFRVSLSPRGRVAGLTGTVPTAHDRRIAEILVMFEPGVESVKNDLQVAR